MCGIVAQFNRDSQPVPRGPLARMAETLSHRGPDSDGYHFSGAGGLGFRRLSIIDLEGGDQPIFNESKSVAAIVNGEIYNYRELRSELAAKGHRFRTNSDAEVTVHLYEEHGDDFVTRLRGMFGLALLDGENDRMLVARDRFGIKQVYFSEVGNTALVASEIKALLAHPSLGSEPNPQAIFEYLSMRYCLDGETFFKGIRSLGAGESLIVSKAGLEVKKYWSESGETDEDLTPIEAVSTLTEALSESVKLHLNADVPVGMFLSGGLDSTTLLAFASEVSDRPIKTFTASFGAKSGVDESAYAELAARHFRADHTQIEVSPVDCSILEELIWHLDQPIGDPAILPTWQLAKAASKEVKVVLTGEGSDEVHGGYNRYLRYWRAAQLRPFLRWAPPPLLNGLGKLPVFGGRIRNAAPILKAGDELQQMIAAQGGADWGRSLLKEGAVDISQHRMKLDRLLKAIHREDPVDRLQQFDRQTWMVADLLPKVDRMTMGNALEARVPYLDHIYFETASRIPRRLRMDSSGTKRILRMVARDRIPNTIVERGQHGFNVPLGNWFRDDFRTMVGMALGTGGLQKRELFDQDGVRMILEGYQRSGSNGTLVWSLVLLELWFRRFID